MREWLPGDWKEDAITRSAARSADAVSHRVIRRHKTVRVVRWTAVAVVIVGAVAVLAPRLDRHAPKDHGRQFAHRTPVQSPAAPQSASQAGQTSPSPAARQNEAAKPASKQAPVDVQVAKHDKGVVVTWQGDPSGEYLVYRCTSPRFDTCSTADVVRGDRWVDREPSRAPIVFYKVEARTGT
jgi:hypothetical protein